MDLKTRQKLCPDLFQLGSNVTYPLESNFDYIINFWDRFPGISFDTIQDFQTFSQTATFYLAQDRDVVTGEDLLGNEYAKVDILFIKIIPGEPLGDYELYSLEELTASFLAHNRFSDPHQRNVVFSRVLIRRLERILLDLFRNSSSAECLLNVIENVGQDTPRRQRVIEEVRELSKEDPERVRSFLMRIHFIGMQMRGWDIERGFPLDSLETNCEIDHLGLSQDIHNFKHDLILENLPLFKYDNSEWSMSSIPEQGYDIGERLRIVIKNEDGFSCIRLSSNWFCATAWYYLNEFFGYQLYEIQKLNYIS